MKCTMFTQIRHITGVVVELKAELERLRDELGDHE